MRRGALLLAVAASLAWALAVACTGDDPVGLGPTDDAGGSEGGTTDSPSATDGAPGDAGDGGPLCDVSPCVVQISAGGAHSCARLDDGTVRCWGNNLLGQAGGGTVTPAADGGTEDKVDPLQYPTPHVVSGIAGATVVGTGGAYRADGVSCAGTKDLKMYCWGQNRSHQLGRGETPKVGDEPVSPARPEPAPVVTITNVKDISVGVRHVCAVFTAGAVACWGGDIQGALGFPPSGVIFGQPQTLAVAAQFERVVARGSHNIALASDKKVWSWGDNGDGQHGVDPDGGATVAAPEPIAALTGSYTDVAAGRVHGCALDVTGKVWCWGRGAEGQLGRGPTARTGISPPAIVSLPAGAIATQIAGDQWHMVALLADGTVWGWGTMVTGITPVSAPDPRDTARDVPVKIELAKRAIQVAAGYEHACALLEGGAVHCWGNNRAGELGRGTFGDGIKPTPAPVVW